MEPTNKKTDQQLINDADQGLRGQGAVVEMMQRLKDSIENLNVTSTKLSKHMLILTWIIAGLTAVSVFVAMIQTYSISK